MEGECGDNVEYFCTHSLRLHVKCEVWRRTLAGVLGDWYQPHVSVRAAPAAASTAELIERRTDSSGRKQQHI